MEDQGPADAGDLELSITGVAAEQLDLGVLSLRLDTTRGPLTGLFHPTEGEGGALLCVGDAAGGLDGPAGKVYERLGKNLLAQGISTLRLEYRQPGEFVECVLDVLGGLSFLKGVGAQRVALAGHSFGGAVVIKAGELSPLVAAVAALSPQTYGTKEVERLAPKPLLLVHGLKDTVLACAASEDIYGRAGEPKRIVMLAESGHSLKEDAETVYGLLRDWVTTTTRDPAHLN